MKIYGPSSCSIIDSAQVVRAMTKTTTPRQLTQAELKERKFASFEERVLSTIRIEVQISDL